MVTIKQDNPPAGMVFTHVEKHILEALHTPYHEVVTDWIRGGRGHFNPILSQTIPIEQVERAELNQKYYARMTS